LVSRAIIKTRRSGYCSKPDEAVVLSLYLRRCAATAAAAAALTVNWRRATWATGVEKSVEVLESAARGRTKRAIGFERTAEIIVKRK
jgi:hypothetical protein